MYTDMLGLPYDLLFSAPTVSAGCCLYLKINLCCPELTDVSIHVIKIVVNDWFRKQLEEVFWIYTANTASLHSCLVALECGEYK